MTLNTEEYSTSFSCVLRGFSISLKNANLQHTTQPCSIDATKDSLVRWCPNNHLSGPNWLPWSRVESAPEISNGQSYGLQGIPFLDSSSIFIRLVLSGSQIPSSPSLQTLHNMTWILRCFSKDTLMPMKDLPRSSAVASPHRAFVRAYRIGKSCMQHNRSET